MSVTYNFQLHLDKARLNSGLKSELQDLLIRNIMKAQSRTRMTNSSISVLTQRLRALNMIGAINEIVNEGKFEIRSLGSLKEKHIDFLVTNWLTKGQQKGTIENKITYLKTFCSWLGKESIVKRPSDYSVLDVLPARSGVAEKDKSWSAAGVDVYQKVSDIAFENPHIAVQLLLQATFGLRRSESYLLRPYEAVFEKDGVKYLRIEHGPKGNRKRKIKMINEDDLHVIEKAKALANTRTGSTIPDHLTKKEWDGKWDYMMTKHGLTKKGLGVTAHGLRHENFNNLYETLTGALSPVRGGVKPAEEVHQMARKIIAENAGHSRISKSNAYIGSTRKQIILHSQSLTNAQIIDALEECDGSRTNAALKLGCARSYLYLRLNEMKTATIAFPPAQPNALSCGVA